LWGCSKLILYDILLLFVVIFNYFLGHSKTTILMLEVIKSIKLVIFGKYMLYFYIKYFILLFFL
jgi:hypothetical protein